MRDSVGNATERLPDQSALSRPAARSDLSACNQTAKFDQARERDAALGGEHAEAVLQHYCGEAGLIESLVGVVIAQTEHHLRTTEPVVCVGRGLHTGYLWTT